MSLVIECLIYVYNFPSDSDIASNIKRDQNIIAVVCRAEMRLINHIFYIYDATYNSQYYDRRQLKGN